MFKLTFLTLLVFSSLIGVSQEIPLNYQLMSADQFLNSVVGNTVVGVTRQSHSLYMLHFIAGGKCELWKQNRIYIGHWWIEKDELERDFVRAFWPDYTSEEAKSLFSPENPRFGTPTSVWYYMDADHHALYLAGRTFCLPAILVPGRPLPL